MKILIGCEESQIICKSFRDIGFEAYSCDLKRESGNHPEWHLQMDIFEAVKKLKPTLGVFHPPCTHLAVSGAKHFEEKRRDGRQKEGIEFFMKCTQLNIKHIAIENPVGIMSNLYRKPDQIIQPYYFGDSFQKTTCLWLKNLPPLHYVTRANLFENNLTVVDKGEFYTWVDKNGKEKKQALWFAQAKGFGGKAKSKDYGEIRSKTFPGIAKAMADQWGFYIRYGKSKYI